MKNQGENVRAKKALKATVKEKKLLVRALELIDLLGEEKTKYIINAFNAAAKAEHNQKQRDFTIALRVLAVAVEEIEQLEAA